MAKDSNLKTFVMELKRLGLIWKFNSFFFKKNWFWPFSAIS